MANNFGWLRANSRSEDEKLEKWEATRDDGTVCEVGDYRMTKVVVGQWWEEKREFVLNPFSNEWYSGSGTWR